MAGIRTTTPAAFLALSLVCGPAMAQDGAALQASRWVTAASAKVRLIAPAQLVDGARYGAVQIDLPPGSKTYWRNPGETGVPTTARFDGSAGLGDLTLDYPVPVAFDDGAGGTAFGYTGSVVLPIHFTPTGGAAKLVVALEFGVCTKTMCIPAQADLELVPGSGSDEPGLSETLRAARAAVPVVRPRGVSDGVGIVSATRGTADGKTVVEVIARVTDGDGTPALFVDAADYYAAERVGAPEGTTARFKVTSGSAPEAGKPLGEITLTLSSRTSATETKLNLDELLLRP